MSRVPGRPSRRRFLRLAGAAGAASMAALGGFPALSQARGASVVVVGGGFGGATAAKYLRLTDPTLRVTLVERDPLYVTCPFSNLVLAGLKTMDDITHRRDALGSLHGVRLVQDEALGIDPGARSIALASGGRLTYDRLVLAPGIDLRFDAVPGYDEAAAEKAPHAWKAGSQTMLLRRQIEAMQDGGTVIIAAPANPFRCPPGPYERASMIAHYLKRSKPGSKIVILDAKENFSKQGLFMPAWEAVYPGMIEWRGGAAGGKVSRIDAAALEVETEFGTERGAVINFIPPQRAGKIAQAAGVADDKGWCPVDPVTFESKQQPGVHVIGDAIYGGAMPKSGTAANSQAKACAAAVAAILAGRAPVEPSLANTCYSLVAPDYGISVTGVYQPTSEGIREVKDSGGVSAAGAAASVRQLEAEYTAAWYSGIIADSFG